MSRDIARTIGKRVQEIRKIKGLTLAELSEKAGICISMISKIENFKTLPPISTYAKIASALGTSIAELIDDVRKDSDISIVKTTERPVISRGQYIVSPLAYKKNTKRMEPFIFSFPAGKRDFRPVQHKTEEMILVIKGAIELRYGEEVFFLRKGDCAYFDGDVPHSARALSSRGAAAVVVQSAE